MKVAAEYMADLSASKDLIYYEYRYRSATFVYKVPRLI
jgi:hypothetical protein